MSNDLAEAQKAAGQTKDLNIDFNACASIVQQGNGQFRLKPVLHAGEVSLDSRAESESPDEFEAEFTAPVVIPDPDKAVAEWAKLKPRFAQSTRICQGSDLSYATAAAPIEMFTTEARWETCLRMNLYGVWQGRALDLEQ